MTTDTISVRARWRHSAMLRQIEAIAVGFLWALEMKRLCDAAQARGQRLDGDSARELMREADRRLARR